MIKICLQCNTTYKTRRSRQKYCNCKCKGLAFRGNKYALGSKHPQKEEHKKKIGIARINKKIQLGYINSPETRKKISELMQKNKYNTGSKRTIEQRKNISLSLKGEKSYTWKGGITPVEKKIRQSFEYKQWRDEIFKRDNFTCMDCGKRGGILRAHHIKLFCKLLQEAQQMFSFLSLYDACMLYAPLWDTNNGITYCKDCHDEYHKQLKIIEKSNKVELWK